MKKAPQDSSGQNANNPPHNQPDAQPESQSLKIVSQQEKRLSKNQQTFNKLIEEVESLSRKLQTEGQTLELLLQEYSKSLPGLKKKFAEGQLSIAKLLDRAAEQVRIGQRQLQSVREVILWFCDTAFQQLNPDEEGKELYTKWADTSYEQKLEKQGEDLIDSILKDLKGRYGIEIDTTGIDASPEGFARLQERINEQMARQQEQQKNNAKEGKTKKQLDKEQKEKELDKEKLKSLRSIYLSLAKMLHPDTATDAAEKLRKEELMKQVSVAYREKDLSALLKLEMEFVASETSHLHSLADDKLMVYINALKEQVDALRQQLHQLRNQPRFADIAHLAFYPEKNALDLIRAYERKLKQQVKEAERAQAFLRDNPDKKEILEFVFSIEEDIHSAG